MKSGLEHTLRPTPPSTSCRVRDWSKTHHCMMCNNCNTRALLSVSVIASVVSEVCFLPVLILVHSHLESKKKNAFCWNWMSGRVTSCPFLVLFLAALLTGILLVSTAIHMVLGYCRPQCGQNRAFLKHLFRFGSFAVNLVVTLLALAFIALIIRFSFSGKSEYFVLQYTGYLLVEGDIPSHYLFILICIGTMANVAATVFSGVVAFKPRRPGAVDEFGEGIFQSFVDHGTPIAYQEINYADPEAISKSSETV